MNKQAELTRWTPKRLLSLLMALIMTLSLLPTAAFADDNPNEWDLNNFKTTGNESESQVIVASGFFAGDARYELRINIDPNKTYMPGDRVSVNAIAQYLRLIRRAGVVPRCAGRAAHRRLPSGEPPAHSLCAH